MIELPCQYQCGKWGGFNLSAIASAKSLRIDFSVGGNDCPLSLRNFHFPNGITAIENNFDFCPLVAIGMILYAVRHEIVAFRLVENISVR